MGTNADDFWCQATSFETQIKYSHWWTCGKIIGLYYLLVDHERKTCWVHVDDSDKKWTWTNGWIH